MCISVLENAKCFIVYKSANAESIPELPRLTTLFMTEINIIVHLCRSAIAFLNCGVRSHAGTHVHVDDNQTKSSTTSLAIYLQVNSTPLIHSTLEYYFLSGLLSVSRFQTTLNL